MSAKEKLPPGPAVVPVRKVTVGKHRRPARNVEATSESVRALGLLNPITVTPALRLVAGRNRLEAAKALGWETIPAVVVDLDERDAELAEIDENLIRSELTALERAEQLKRRKELYEAKYPEAARPQGGRPKENGDTVSPFSEATAGTVGASPRTIQREVRIAERLTLAAREELRETPLADNQSELLKLASVEPAKQLDVVRRVLSGDCRTVAQARAAIRAGEAPPEPSPPPPAPEPPAPQVSDEEEPPPCTDPATSCPESAPSPTGAAAAAAGPSPPGPGAGAATAGTGTTAAGGDATSAAAEPTGQEVRLRANALLVAEAGRLAAGGGVALDTLLSDLAVDLAQTREALRLVASLAAVDATFRADPDETAPLARRVPDRDAGKLFAWLDRATPGALLALALELAAPRAALCRQTRAQLLAFAGLTEEALADRARAELAPPPRTPADGRDALADRLTAQYDAPPAGGAGRKAKDRRPGREPRRCRGCGCTDAAGCPGAGCYWVEEKGGLSLCSSCEGKGAAGDK